MWSRFDPEIFYQFDHLQATFPLDCFRKLIKASGEQLDQILRGDVKHFSFFMKCPLCYSIKSCMVLRVPNCGNIKNIWKELNILLLQRRNESIRISVFKFLAIFLSRIAQKNTNYPPKHYKIVQISPSNNECCEQKHKSYTKPSFPFAALSNHQL